MGWRPTRTDSSRRRSCQMANAKRASMREGPLAALFRRTVEETAVAPAAGELPAAGGQPASLSQDQPAPPAPQPDPAPAARQPDAPPAARQPAPQPNPALAASQSGGPGDEATPPSAPQPGG